MDNLMLCVGLTGGIGSGKTTVAQLFAQLGATIIDADLIAREATAPGTPGLAALVAHFGEDIVTATQELDRHQLRNIIFQNKSERIWLENTLHPLILQVIRQQIQAATSPYCIIAIPLLAESSLSFDFLDRVCVVDAPESLRKQWAASRDNVPISQIEAIITAQSSRERRLALADDVIINDQDLAALSLQVQQLHQRYLDLCH